MILDRGLRRRSWDLRTQRRLPRQNSDDPRQGTKTSDNRKKKALPRFLGRTAMILDRGLRLAVDVAVGVNFWLAEQR